MKYWYSGSLYKRPSLVEEAYQSWAAQKSKCYNKNSRLYRYYGAKGIKVLYSSREYVGWWIEQSKKKKTWKKKNCGRIDHDGDYCFENIEMQEASENVAERNTRISSKPVAFFENGNFICSFSSVVVAAKHFNVDSTVIAKKCRKQNRKSLSRKLNRKYGFSYIGACHD